MQSISKVSASLFTRAQQTLGHRIAASKGATGFAIFLSNYSSNASGSKARAARKAEKKISTAKPNLKLELIPIDKLKDVFDHQKRSFFCNDPLHTALGICQDPDSLKGEMEYTKKVIGEGMSVMAVADGKVVGAHIGGPMCPGMVENALAEYQDPQKPFEKILYLKAKANAKVNLFEKYDVDAIYEVKMASIDEKYRNSNFISDALKMNEKIAREAGFQLMKVEASGAGQAEMLEKLGFESASETRYDSILDKDCNVLIPVKEPNTSFKIMVKKLE